MSRIAYNPYYQCCKCKLSSPYWVQRFRNVCINQACCHELYKDCGNPRITQSSTSEATAPPEAQITSGSPIHASTAVSPYGSISQNHPGPAPRNANIADFSDPHDRALASAYNQAKAKWEQEEAARKAKLWRGEDAEWELDDTAEHLKQPVNRSGGSGHGGEGGSSSKKRHTESRDDGGNGRSSKRGRKRHG